MTHLDCCVCHRAIPVAEAYIPHLGKPEPGGPFCKWCLDARVDAERLDDARGVLRQLLASAALVYEDRELVQALLLRLG